MGKFQVTTGTVFEFEAENKEQAKWLVENGEMPREHELIDAFIFAVQDVSG